MLLDASRSGVMAKKINWGLRKSAFCQDDKEAIVLEDGEEPLKVIDIVVEVRAGHKDAMQVWAFTLFPLLKKEQQSKNNFLLLTKKSKRSNWLF